MKEYSIGDVVTDGEMFDALEKLSGGKPIKITVPVSHHNDNFNWNVAKQTGIVLGSEYILYTVWERKANGYYSYWERIE